MTCKYLTTAIKIIPGGVEIGGPVTPQKTSVRACKLNRKPDIMFWATKCNETPQNGPCWFWIDEKGSQVDVEFTQASQKSD